MDISVGSTTEKSGCQPGLDLGNADLSDSVGESGQGKSSTAPAHSTAARFQIRTAKERQRMLEPTKGLKKTLRSETEASNSEKEVLRARPYSPPSPDPDVTNKRIPRALNQVRITKDSELQTGSETSETTWEKPDSVGSLTTRVRGRTEWRRANLTNRSKSLDWRGSNRGQEVQSVVNRNTKDFTETPRRRSESLEKKRPGSDQVLNDPTSPSNSVSLRIRAYNAIGQAKQDSNVNISPALSGFSSLRINRVANVLEQTSSGQSLPSRLKPMQKQDSTEDSRSLWWHSGQSSPKSDQTEVQLRSPVSEITGNQTIQDRIGKLFGMNVSEDNTDANSRGSLRSKRYSAPVDDWLSSPDAIDSNSSQRKLANDSVSGLPSSSSYSQQRRVSYDMEKGATFPRKLSKKEGTDLSYMTDTPSVLSNKNVRQDTLANTPVATWSKERPLTHDSTGVMTVNSDRNGRTQAAESLLLGTRSLDRARSRNSATALSRALKTEALYSAYDSSKPSNDVHPTRQESIEKKMESDWEADNPNHVKVMETSPRKQEISLFSSQSKPQLTRSRTVDSENGNDEIKNSKTKKGSLEKVPSFERVRNTIHKFEALAQQSKSPTQSHLPRRAFSVPEKPRPVVGLSKSNSDKWEGKGFLNPRNLRESFFSRSDTQEEDLSSPDLDGPAQITTTVQSDLTIKTKSKTGSKQEFGVVPKQLETFSSDQGNEAKDIRDDTKNTVMNRHMDEPDFSNTSHQNLKNIDSTEHKAGTLFYDPKKKSDRNTDLPHSDAKNSSISSSQNKSLEDVSIQNHVPQSNSRTKDDKTFQTPESTKALPDSVPSTLFKSASLSANNNAQLKSPAIFFSDSAVTPVQDFSSAPADLNPLRNVKRDEKAAAKVSRWIAYERDGVNVVFDEDEYDNDDDDDQDNEETDSDSGDSSVTITSNMSQSESRSFSVSLADLCNLGGLDYPPSDGNGSKDEEKWMSRRSASLSSDISVLSSVTLLATEELDCLLEDVKGLGDDTLQNCEDVQVVVLHKEVGRGLGFTVAGGVDQNKPVTVHRVFPCGAAGQEGSIHEGDQVLSINGTALHNSCHWEALRTLRKARGRGMAVVVLRPGTINETQFSFKDSLQKPAGNPGSRVRVTLTKSSADLGFSLEGGVGSSLGDKPLTVQRLFQGGPVGEVLPGDELLEVQGQRLSGLRRLEAWNLIKRLPPGPVEVLLHRHNQPL